MNSIKDKIEKSPASNNWKGIGVKTHHGINIPLFSIHTKNSCGIGEFYDLVPLIDWCKELELDVIQLLPINDCGNDTSPYNASSACALNPIFLSFSKLPYLNKHPLLKKKLPELQKLTTTPRISYHEVQIHKMAWLREYFHHLAPTIMQTQQFENFIANNGWIEPYALFKVLKDLNSQHKWTAWPREFKTPTLEEYTKLIEDHFGELAFYIVVQYLCFHQLSSVKKYANSHGVLLKGDIPILISPDSCDVWHEPQLFDTSVAAGAPPDMYSDEGQHWGFPLYNWELMRESNYAWWKQRLQTATPLYNLYRIDHVLGFFRIWAIPHGRSPKEGYYVPEDELLWAAHGKGLLSMMLSSSPMLPIGEDLGCVIPLVHRTLDELGICGTRVPRWERYWDTDSSFVPINKYSPLTMTTVSTHDSETLSIWWRDHEDEAREYGSPKGWSYSEELTYDQRKMILWESHHSSSLFHVNLLPEYLALFPEMIWPRPEDERINIPSTLLSTNWTYRLRLSLEEITSNDKLKAVMKEICHSPTPPNAK